jgi:hypothetical protein
LGSADWSRVRERPELCNKGVLSLEEILLCERDRVSCRVVGDGGEEEFVDPGNCVDTDKPSKVGPVRADPNCRGAAGISQKPFYMLLRSTNRKSSSKRSSWE